MMRRVTRFGARFGLAPALCLSATAGAATIFVDDDTCPSAGDGTIGNPFCSIQDAIDAAVDGVDDVEVAAGTYFESIDFTGKAITVRSTGGPGVTTIDGTGFLHVVQCISGEGSDTVLDGFTIADGNADGVVFPDNSGGGMYNDGSSPTVTDCIFIANGAVFGAGMLNFGSASPTVTECAFLGNTATTDGGAIYNSSTSDPTVINCTFSGNSAAGDGGGMFNIATSSPTLTNCTFSGNTAGSGGAIFNGATSAPTVTNCILWGNVPSGIVGGTPVVTFSDVQGGAGGSGNINTDPFFADADGPDDTPGTEDDNLRPLLLSPVIDAGTNFPPGGLPATDLDGNGRPLDGDIDGIPTADMGAYELNPDNFAIVRNVSQGILYGSLAFAIGAATDGDLLLATEGAFLAEPDVDFLDKTLVLRSLGEINQAAGGLYQLANGSTLESAVGADVNLGGELRADTGDSADVFAEQLTTTGTGSLVARNDAALFITAPGSAALAGETFLFPGATMSFSDDVETSGTSTLLGGSNLVVGAVHTNSGDLTALDADLTAGSVVNDGSMTASNASFVADSYGNSATGVFTGFGEIFADVINDGDMTYIGNTVAVGDYTNNGTTTVQIGTLTIIGTLINNGTIIGDVVTALAGGTQPGDGLDITGDYVAGAGAALVMPDPVWRLTVGGNYDVAVNNNANYHMAQAELRMAGSVQALEIMSTDIGSDPAGLDRTLPGHYPIGTLRIGPTPTTVDMVDSHDNDGMGQVVCEAIYVTDLVIEAGATLNTNGCNVYYSTLTLDGAVDDPGNLIEIVVVPPCPQDITGDGVVNVLDLIDLLLCFGQPATAPCDMGQDVNGDGTVNVLDLIELLLAFGTACP